MRKNHLYLLVLAVLCGSVLLTSAALGFSGTIGKEKQVAVKGGDEHGARTNAAAKGTATGQKSTAAGNAASGSSEHSSVRGTINGGGDFIGPKLNDKTPNPRGTAPRAPQ